MECAIPGIDYNNGITKVLRDKYNGTIQTNSLGDLVISIVQVFGTLMPKVLFLSSLRTIPTSGCKRMRTGYDRVESNQKDWPHKQKCVAK
eukprot:scaffold5355_cov51-Attheya_sp.AAC.2